MTRTNHPGRRLGRLPNDPEKPRLRLVMEKGVLPLPPSIQDWSSLPFDWGVAVNDKLGCCTVSSAAHMAMQTQWYGQDARVYIPDAEIIRAYSAVSGYKPGDDSTDNGAVIQDVLNFWRTTGVGGYKIEAFAQVDANNIDLVRLCVSIFGAVNIGMNFPSSAMDQFDTGATWTPVAHARSEGGHAVPIVGYDQKAFTCVTWGKLQKMDLAFWKKYVVPEKDVWVAIDTDWLRKVGTSPAGLDVVTLNADYLSVTGASGPGPFSSVVPAPGPPSNLSDKTLATAMRAWLKERGL